MLTDEQFNRLVDILGSTATFGFNAAKLYVQSANIMALVYIFLILVIFIVLFKLTLMAMKKYKEHDDINTFGFLFCMLLADLFASIIGTVGLFTSLNQLQCILAVDWCALMRMAELVK